MRIELRETGGVANLQRSIALEGNRLRVLDRGQVCVERELPQEALRVMTSRVRALEDARRVARLISHPRAKVNLIPWNPGELPYRAPDAEHIEEFRRILADKGVPALVRYSRGQDIMAACGQLALLETPEQAPSTQTAL